MGYDWVDEQMEHVSFGMVGYEGEARSLQEGDNVIYLDDLLEKSVEKALKNIRRQESQYRGQTACSKAGGV